MIDDLMGVFITLATK
jgi:hypothetical protein